MKPELRARQRDDHSVYYELFLLAESEAESKLLDQVFGDRLINRDGLITQMEGDVRLADGYCEHYLLLRRASTP